MAKTKKIVTTTSEYDPKTGKLIKKTTVETADKCESAQEVSNADTAKGVAGNDSLESSEIEADSSAQAVDIFAALERMNYELAPKMDICVTFGGAADEEAEESLASVELVIAEKHLELARMYQDLAALHME